jgi:glutamine amidotransferase
MNIGVINTNTSNIKSVYNALKYLNFNNFIEITSLKDTQNKKFTHLIFPGNGSFKSNIKTIRDQQLDNFLIDSYNNNIFFLGICVGMQILATYGEENGIINGLNIIPGRVVKIPVKLKKLPHIGWNQVVIKKKDQIFNNLLDLDNIFYFLHSYYFNLDDNLNCLSSVNYDLEFPIIVRKKNFYGFQFHPEKSQSQGLKLIKNFLELR